MGYPNQVTTANKGEPTHPPTIYPSIYQLVYGCSMKPDKNHQYRVQDLRIENIIVIVLKFVDGFLSNVCIKKLHCLNSLFNEMATDVRKLSTLREKILESSSMHPRREVHTKSCWTNTLPLNLKPISVSAMRKWTFLLEFTTGGSAIRKWKYSSH